MQPTTGNSMMLADEPCPDCGSGRHRACSQELLNPAIHCVESVHIEEPLHHREGGLTNPFFKSEKVVDKDPDVR